MLPPYVKVDTHVLEHTRTHTRVARQTSGAHLLVEEREHRDTLHADGSRESTASLCVCKVNCQPGHLAEVIVEGLDERWQPTRATVASEPKRMGGSGGAERDCKIR